VTEKLTVKTVNGFFWLTLMKLLSAVFQLVVLAVLSRLLSPVDFGLMSIVFIMLSFADIFNDIGLGPAITQKENIDDTDIATSFTSSIFLGIFVFIFLQLSASFIADFFNNQEVIPVLKSISFILFLTSISTTAKGLLYRKLEFKKLTIVTLLSYITGYGCVSIFLALKGFGVWALVWGVLCQNIILTFLLFYYVNESFKLGWNKASFQGLFGFGSGYTLGRIFTFIANQGDKIIIGRFMDVATLGLYERSFQVVRYTAGLMGEIIDKVLFSPIARKQNDLNTISRVFLDITYVLSIVLFPLSVYMSQNAKYIVILVLGEKWSSSIPIVVAMSLTLFFWVTTKLGNTVAKSLGAVYERALRNFVYAVMVILSAYIGVQYNIIIVAYLISIVLIVNYVFSYIQIKKLTKLKHWNFVENHILGLVVALIGFLITYALKRLTGDFYNNTYINLAVSGIVYSIVVIIAVYKFDYKGVFLTYLNRIRSK